MASAPRRRRRRWWLVALLALALALTAATVSLRSDAREIVAFYDVANPEAVSQVSAAQTFQELIRSELGEVDRKAFMTVIGQLREGTLEGIGQVGTPQAPPAALAAQEMLLVALQAWQEGLGDFASALLEAVDQPESPIPERDLELALTTLRVGDAAYERFVTLAEAIRSRMDVAAPAMPAVSYMGGEPPIVSSRVVEAARLSASLGLVVDVGISAVRITPEEITDPGATVSVIPSTDSIDVTVVVANLGNRPEQSIRVSLTMTTDGGSLLFQDQQILAELLPGSQQPAIFSSLSVEPSQAYDLDVAITKVADEDSSYLENNFHSKRFVVNDTTEP